MKPIYLLIALYLFVIQRGYGQNQQDVKLSELKAPSSPAFTILQIQPNDISRPKDFNSLELSLLNAVSKDNNLTLPTSFALEATPYWLKGRDITFKELESSTDLFSTLWQTLSISLAASQRTNYIDSTQKVNQIGIGFRSYLAKGRLANQDNIKNAINTINNTSKAILSFVQILNLSKRYIDHNPAATKNLSVDGYRTLMLDLLKLPFTKIRTVALPQAKDKKIDHTREIRNMKSDSTRAEEILKALNESKDIKREFARIYLEVVAPFANKSIILDEDDAKEIADKLVDEIQTSYIANEKFLAKIDEIQAYREKRVGWLLEFAGATALETPKPGIRDIGAGKIGLWLTLTNRPEKLTGFEWILLARFLTEDSEIRRTKNYDGGGRLVYDNGKLILSGETLIRTEELITRREFINGSLLRESTLSTHWRWGFSIGYRINQHIVIQGSFAKSLSSDLLYQGGYVSLLGVNFGFGQPVLIPEKTP